MSAFVVLVKTCAGIALVPEVCMVSLTPAGCVVVQAKLTPAVVLLNVTAAVLFPEQIVCGLSENVIAGDGLILMVKVFDVPGQPLLVGVTVIVAVIGAEVLLIAVKAAISPDPVPGIPMVGLSLVQLYVVPEIFPVNGIKDVCNPLHTS